MVERRSEGPVTKLDSKPLRDISSYRTTVLPRGPAETPLDHFAHDRDSVPGIQPDPHGVDPSTHTRQNRRHPGAP